MLDELGKRTADVIGTVRKDRKALPKDVNAKLNKGETKTAYSPQYNAMRMQWKDKGDVLMLSSCIPGESVSVVRRGKEVTVPLVINIYNNIMGGVDLSDQMMNSYPIERKRLKTWYKKMWIHLANSCVFNAHILHKKKGGKLTSLEFLKLLKNMEKTLKIIDEGVDLVRMIIHSDQLNDVFLIILHQQKRKLMPPNGALFVENVVSEKNHTINVSGVMQHFMLLFVLKFIIKLRYFKCYC